LPATPATIIMRAKATIGLRMSTPFFIRCQIHSKIKQPVQALLWR
jgi:hypothetical protein